MHLATERLASVTSASTVASVQGMSTRVLNLPTVPVAEVPAERPAVFSFVLHRQFQSKLLQNHQVAKNVSSLVKPSDTEQSNESNAIIARLGTSLGKAGKPTVVIDKSHHIWLLNSGEESLTVTPGELFGFGTGQYSIVNDCASPNVVFGTKDVL